MKMFQVTINQKEKRGDNGFFYNEYLLAKSKLELVKLWRKYRKKDEDLNLFVIMNIEDLGDIGECTPEDITELEAEDLRQYI